jgi:hypothetical protein
MLLLLSFVVLTGADGGGCGGGEGPPLERGGERSYVTELNGLPAVATLTFEPLVTHTRVDGIIESSTARYVLGADVVGESGYGDMVDVGLNERMRIHLAFSTDGFRLTVNPLGGATVYDFSSCSDCRPVD